MLLDADTLVVHAGAFVHNASIVIECAAIPVPPLFNEMQVSRFVVNGNVGIHDHPVDIFGHLPQPAVLVIAIFLARDKPPAIFAAPLDCAALVKKQRFAIEQPVAEVVLAPVRATPVEQNALAVLFPVHGFRFLEEFPLGVVSPEIPVFFHNSLAEKCLKHKYTFLKCHKMTLALSACAGGVHQGQFFDRVAC